MDLIRNLALINTGHVRMGRTTPEQHLERGLGRFGANGHDFDSPVCQVAGIAANAKLAGVAGHEPAESHPLHPPGDQVSEGHAMRLRRARKASSMIGRIDSAMIARMTSVKFSRTTGILPKK